MIVPKNALWAARVVLSAVFIFNIQCALYFIAAPEAYTGSFEVSGVAGAALIRGMGILFLMWNATYPPAIWHPWRYRWLFLIIIVQQAIGAIGETWMLLVLPAGHATLAQTGWRFVAFDGGGLLGLLGAFVWMQNSMRKYRRTQHTAIGPVDHLPTTHDLV